MHGSAPESSRVAGGLGRPARASPEASVGVKLGQQILMTPEGPELLSTYPFEEHLL